MHETYRMLGKEHDADFERDAQKRRLAAEAKAGRTPTEAAPVKPRRIARARILALLTRAARAQG